MGVRQATAEDIPLITELGNMLIEDSSLGFYLFKGLVLNDELTLQAVNIEDTRIINDGAGFVSYTMAPWLNQTIGKILYIYLIPEWRDKGLMREVKQDFEEWAKNKGCTFTMLGITNGVEPEDYIKFEEVYMKEVK